MLWAALLWQGAAAPVCSLAAIGDLDSSFGGGGRVLVNLGSSLDSFNTIDALPDGKLLAAGNGAGHKPVLVRLLPDGALDPNYADGGVLIAPEGGFGGLSHAFADGSAILAYQRIGTPAANGMAASRITPAGAIDPAFGVDGIAFIPTNAGSLVLAMTVDASGGVYVAGVLNNGSRTDWIVAKFTAAGAPDSTFGDGGVVITDFSRPGVIDPHDYPFAVKVDPQGRLVVGGSTSTDAALSNGNIIHAIARYTPQGELDASFDGDGKAVFGFDSSVFDREFVSDVEFLADGDLLLASAGGSDTALVRLNDDGSFATEFGDGGVASFAYRSPLANPRDIRVDELGRILLVGDAHQPGSTATDFAIGRVLASGAPDTSFAGGGRIETFSVPYSAGYALDLQPDGKLVAAGSGGRLSPVNDTRALIARYLLTPEPAALGLAGCGALVLAGSRRARRGGARA